VQPLADEFNGKGNQADYGKLFLPQRAVKLNRPWAINPRLLVRDLGQAGGVQFAAAGARATGTLTRVYQQGGHRFGTLNFVLNLPIASLQLGTLGTVATPHSAALLHLTVDGCIDGSSSTAALKFDMQMSIHAAVTTPKGRHFVVTFSDHATDAETDRELPKAAP
jgi:hypothetical protein